MSEMETGKRKLAGMKAVRRDCGVGGWVIDYKTLERITVEAGRVEPVSMEQAEAVILALVYERFMRMEDE